jgi:hypothetical protein
MPFTHTTLPIALLIAARATGWGQVLNPHFFHGLTPGPRRPRARTREAHLSGWPE